MGYQARKSVRMREHEDGVGFSGWVRVQVEAGEALACAELRGQGRRVRVTARTGPDGGDGEKYSGEAAGTRRVTVSC